MASRAGARSHVLPRAAWHRTLTWGRRAPSSRPQRILVCHHLLLGDTIMLTPLIAKLRHQYPSAEIVMAMPNAYAPLYSNRPYNMVAKGFDPRSRASVAALTQDPGFDLALIPGDNRLSWTAAALQARWIVALAHDRPAYKSWPVDEFRDWPTEPATLEDIFASLATGSPAPTFRTQDWSPPVCQPFVKPARPYAVFHVGASSELRFWAPEKWRTLAMQLEAAYGLEIVWSAGPKEDALVSDIDPTATRTSYAGKLSLAQLWHLLSEARLLVCPDTGVSHIAKVVGCPTVTLFGPGSRPLFGPSTFWGDIAWRGVGIDPFPCRDQHTLFKRSIPWVTRCQRTTLECPAPRCMQAISVESVLETAQSLLARNSRSSTTLASQ